MKTPTDQVMLLPLQALGQASLAQVGGKAASLGRLLQLGLPVPPGFCLTTHCFDDAVARIDALPLLQHLDACPADALEQARPLITTLRQRLEADRLPPALLQSLAEHLEAGGYAVRSSATAEDLPEASFAGQQETFLNVRGLDALVDAIRRCWASLYSERAVSYRKQQGLRETQVKMAVVVQRLVEAEVAGVLFTADPVSGPDAGMVLEAAPGLGELLVSGQVSPDRWRVDRLRLNILETTLGSRAQKLVALPSGGTEVRPIPEEEASAPCLTPAQLTALAGLGLQAEAAFGGPQDLEFALAGGALWILQSRPITTLAHRPPAGQPGHLAGQELEDAPGTGQGDLDAAFEAVQVWSNMNAGEVLPDVVTPMTWSMIDSTLLTLFKRMLTYLGIDAGRHPIGGVVGGRVYFNMNTTLGLIQAMPFVRRANISRILGGVDADLDAAGARELLLKHPAPVSLHPLVLLWRVPLFALWFLTRTFRGGRAKLDALILRIDAAARTPLQTLSDQALVAAIRWPFEELGREVETILGYPMVGMAGYATLERFLGTHFPGEASPVNKLLLGQGGMASAEAGMALGRMARAIAANGPLRDCLLRASCFAEAAERVSTVPGGTDFLVSWQAFMAQHGHHARGEIELATPRWEDQPDYVLHQLQGYLSHGELPDPDALQQANAERAQRAAQEARASLPSILHRWRFDRLLAQTRQGVAFRENVKSHAVRLIALARRGALEAGRRLTQKGILSDPESVFFLKLEELYTLLEGGPSGDLPARVQARKAQHARFLAVPPPPVVVGRFDPEKVLRARAQQAAAAGATSTSSEVRQAGADPSSGPERFLGLAVCPGVVRGQARVILRADASAKVLPGEILVAPFTDPGWTPYFLPAAGIVMDMGGLLSHGSIVAREYGKPAVVNVGPATRVIQTGDWLEVDGTHGIVTRLQPSSAAPKALG